MLRTGRESRVFGVFCFGDKARQDYRLTLPGSGRAELLLDSDWQCFGGNTPRKEQTLTAGKDGVLTLDLAPYSGQLYLWTPDDPA